MTTSKVVSIVNPTKRLSKGDLAIGSVSGVIIMVTDVDYDNNSISGVTLSSSTFTNLGNYGTAWDYNSFSLFKGSVTLISD